METKPLERFATQARRDLLSAVDARATTVLAAGSVARAERPEVVRKLESEIATHGREHVVDKVAYTWFNRIVALRFMDARGYTDAGIVSPAQGQPHGQPEILAEAKRGNLDTHVLINRTTAETILGLLDGSRRSTDSEGEAYAMLLTEYCRHWHKSMPFMFEREGDYTELLVPTGLLADGAILSTARQALSEEVCDDVEVIGWLYQFYISERKDEVFAGFKKNKKAGPDEIPAATQLFTPHWIVRYLVENSVGRLWMMNRPTSRLVDQMDFYIPPVDDESDFVRITGPEELTVIDPACGSGHMLTYAFDLLYAIYEEEGYAPSEIPGRILTHNLHGTEIDPRAGSLAAFALAMKARARRRTFFSQAIEPNIRVIEPITFGSEELAILAIPGDGPAEDAFWRQFEQADTFGALIRPDEALVKRFRKHVADLDEDGDLLTSATIARARRFLDQASTLTRKYAALTANPPYMGAGNMSPRLNAFVREMYPAHKQDLYACFIKRGIEMTMRGGPLAFVTGDTWMFIKSFEALREEVISQTSFTSLIHVRDSGNLPSKFGANSAFIATVGGDRGKHAAFIRTSLPGITAKRGEVEAALNLRSAASNWFEASTSDLGLIPGTPIAYWIPEELREAFSRGISLAEVVPTREGLTTGDNERFLRRWYEVGSSAADGWSTNPAGTDRRWYPYLKGGEYRLWWGNHEYVVDWENDGERQRRNIDARTGRVRSHNYNGDYAFLQGFTWTGLSSGGFSGRFVPPGFMFDAKAPMAFPSSGERSEAVLAILNSSTGAAFLKVLAPTLDFKLGTVMSTPAPARSAESLLIEGLQVTQLVDVARSDWDDFETSWDFESPSWLASNDAVPAETLEELFARWSYERVKIAQEQAEREAGNNSLVAQAYGLADVVESHVPLHRVSLARNVQFRYGPGKTSQEYAALERADLAAELVSYAVGCIFGRYSLDVPGLVLADQGATLQDYSSKVPFPRFRPDVDNAIPFVEDGWFEDDVVERFRQLLRVAFGAEHFDENLRFVEESLGVKTLRDYFITKAGKSKFYDDHVQRYKKRPIYWMFSSPNGTFNALIYMHRYDPSTVSTVLNEYLREYRAKLEVALANAERAGAAGSSKDQKEADRIRIVLAELRDYEHDVLYPLATQQIVIDLNDGVKTNYPKFYPALRKIAGLEAAE